MNARTATLLACFAAMASIAEGFPSNDAVRATLRIDYETKAFTYGLVDADDPVLMPFGALTLFNTLTFGSLFIVDTSHYGEKVGRGDCAWDFWEVDFPVDMRHVFSADEIAWLPTSVEIGAGYRYEYHPPRTGIRDTQFWVSDVALPDLWIVPRLAYERDTVRDNGTYLNGSLARTFALAEDLDLTLTVGQGFGNEQRVGGYLPKANGEPLDKAGLMDTDLKAELGWMPLEWMRVSCFVAYYDFLFDRQIREGARRYQPRNAGWHGDDTSWHFAAGIAITFLFG